jgi:hypothetical protein
MRDANVAGMRGVITTRDVIANLRLIWREFGSRCALRCVVAVVMMKKTTFLELVYGTRSHLT